MANASLAAMLLLLTIWMGKASTENEEGRAPYIVHIINSMKPRHFTSHKHWYASMLDQVSELDPNANSSASELLYTYDTLLHGFAAMLSREEAKAMDNLDGCLAVIPSSVDKIATTHTPEFLGLASSPSSSGLWSQYSTYGKDIIVGMIDTGIWPESKSFDAQGLGPVPTRWNGTCESGQDFNSSHCSSKIIGARYYFKGYEKLFNTRINGGSPRDTNGHGTHTASTVAGAAAVASSYFGFANGTARGMAPQARLAIYKACWAQGCVDADTVAAMEQAIVDGVDIISISIGSADVPFYRSPRAIAAFGVIERGVLVSAAAGNDGPFSSTLHNTAPWITTVGASSIDRDFPASVVLGNQEIYRGTSTFKDKISQPRPLPLVYVSTNSSSRRCLAGSLDPNVVTGKIVVCDQLLFSNNEGESNALMKGNVVAKAGGAGMIVANEKLYGAQQHFTSPNNLPAISVSFTAGEKIKAYISSAGNNNATATMELTGLTVVGKATTAPLVAAFSSRGPSAGFPHVLKPDMIAPGVNILAAYAARGLDYNLESGTSMACPHVSGIAALIKSVHPTWSPAAIKSALMTSSYILDNAEQPIRDSYTMDAADPFARGAGHVDPRAAVDPGLVYDMEPRDYINFLCSLNYTRQQIALLTKDLVSCADSNSSSEAGDLNYPSFSVLFDLDNGNKSIQVKRRTVTYVGKEGHAVFQASVKNPSGINISVEPETLEFKNFYDKASYNVRVENKVTSPVPGSDGYTAEFGEIRWTCITGGTYLVRSPVAVIWVASN